MAWLEYIEPLKKFFDKDSMFDGDKRIFIPTINNYFFDNSEFYEWIIEKDQEQDRRDKIAEKFNGNIVMDITDLRGKKLGKFINNFKNWIENTLGDFDEYALNEDESTIKGDIKTYYGLTKNFTNEL